MATRNNSGKLAELSDDSFKNNLNELIPLIEAEWPGMDTELIRAAEGDLNAVVDYIATQTEHTRTLVRRQLAELNGLAIRDRIAQEAQVKPMSNGSSASSSTSGTNGTNGTNGSGLSSEIDQILQVLERHTEDLVGQFKKDVLPEVSDRARSNIGTSLLTALGIGFLLGIIIGGGRGR